MGAAGAPDPESGAAVSTLPVSRAFEALGSRPSGLTRAEARERLARLGPNALVRMRGPSLLRRLLSHFTHLMAVLLWAGGAAAFAARLPQIGAAVWIVNLINGAFSFFQEFRAERAVEALAAVLPRSVRLLREGREVSVAAEEVVTGDVLLLAEGDRVSADARVVAEAELRVDQSTLTGEAHPVRKSAEPAPGLPGPRSALPCLVFAGTTVSSGSGRAVAFATGMATELGAIARLTQALPQEPSPLQREMGHLTRLVTALAVGAGLGFGALAVALVGVRPAEGFLFALGMIVAFVPEGLLPTVTLALAMGVQRMARRNALVKRLSAVEALGCASVVCTDKTGTLTENEMTLRGLWLPGGAFAVEGTGYTPEGAIRPQGEGTAPTEDLLRLLAAAARCSNARLHPPGEERRWTVVGDPTEAALLVAARKAGLDLDALAREAPRQRELPFDSRRKRMTTLHRREGGNRPLWFACVKGAPREVLDLCTGARLRGELVSLGPALRADALAAVDAFARQGLRVLAVGERTLPAPGRRAGAGAWPAEAVERDLTFLGLAAMADPPRPEVAAAVATCRRAGIRVVMITGDYGLTAESVARRIGVVGDGPVRVLSGGELDDLGDEALDEALAGPVLFARTSPEQKLRVVAAFQRLGHVVAVTGDGVNDAPALRKADIGVAMGRSGTDVAREAADVVLLDDNFASIVAAVEEGRSVYANLRKFATLFFTSNAAEAAPFVLFVLSRGRVPLALTVMQVLAIDLGTDLLPGLALGAEPPEPGVMDRPPRRPGDHVLTGAVLRRAFVWLGGLEAAACLGAFYLRYWTAGYGRWLDLPAQGALYRSATALALGAVVACQVGNNFAQRTERTSALRIPVASNPLLLAGTAVEIGLLALLVLAPPLQAVFDTAAFEPPYWLLLAACAPVPLVVDEARKAWLRRREHPREGERP